MLLRHLIPVIFVACAVSQAAPRETHAQELETITIATVVAPPVLMEDKDMGEATGEFVDIVRHALRAGNFQAEFILSNWARAYHRAKTGEADAVMPTLFSEDRLGDIAYTSTPISELQFVVMGQKGRNYRYDGSVQSLVGYSLGRILNSKVSPEFDQAVADGVIVPEDRIDFDLLTNALAQGRLDLIVAPRRAALWGAAKAGVLGQVSVIPPEIGFEPVYLALSRNSPYLSRIDEISDLIKRYRERGEAAPDEDAALAVN